MLTVEKYTLRELSLSEVDNVAGGTTIISGVLYSSQACWDFVTTVTTTADSVAMSSDPCLQYLQAQLGS